MMAAYSIIAIIYNPHATGNGRQLANDLVNRLKTCLPDQKFEIIATKRIGHAEQIAYDLATQHSRPLIISASGDGGYHEVVNGLIRAQAKGARPIAGLLPAGNANDHHRNTQSGDLVSAICNQQLRQIDILVLHSTVAGKPYERFAHSYIGFGMNAELANKLSDIPHTFWSEFKTGLQIIWDLHKTRLSRGGVEQATFGAICSNVSSMAKHFVMAREAKINDGKFEVNEFRSRGRLGLYKQVFIAAARGFKNYQTTEHYRFTALEPTMVQLDGEVITIDEGAIADIRIMPSSLQCIV